MERPTTLRPWLLASLFLLSGAAFAQTARVQIIHNCADALANSVDIYVDGTLAVPSLTFRKATSFVDLPAATPIEVGIAPGGSTGPGDIIASFPFTLDDGGTYVIVANGIVSPVGYEPAQPFDLDVYAAGREAALTGTNTDVLVCHGSTDAPPVDVAEIGIPAGQLVNNLSYGEFDGYLELPTGDYVLEVQDSDGNPLVAYDAPLSTLGLDGAAITVVASGFLNPEANSNGAPFGLFVALASGGSLVELPLAAEDEFAHIQVIHNSADAAVGVVDIYINDVLAVNDLAFRTATPFVEVPAGVDLNVGIAPGTSTDPSEAIASFTYNLSAGESYVIVANGIVSGGGYFPPEPFDLDVFAGAREVAQASGTTDVLVCHGSTDAPVVDVAEISIPAGTLVNDLAYGSFAGYLELGTSDYVIEVQTAAGAPVVAYEAPLETLGIDGAAITVVASGFLDPANNSDGPSFGLWVALASGGALVPLPVYEADPTARVQVIHNSADAAAAEVDVYINDELALDDFAFRTATPFLDLPAGVDLAVGVAPGNSDGPEDIIATFDFNLEDGGSYVIVANGIVSPVGYSPAQPFDLDVFATGQESSPVGTTSVLVAHGSTDAPVVDVAELAILDGATLVDDIAYGEFAGYLEVPTANYALQVQTSAGAPVATYEAPLATLGLDEAAITVVASGFLAPANNSNGPAFGLWVALTSGGALVPLPLVTNVGIVESTDDGLSLEAWPNPANDVLNLNIAATEDRRIGLTITDMTGRVAMEGPVSMLNAGENRMTVDLSSLSNGLYTLSLTGNNGVRTLPLQVVR